MVGPKRLLLCQGSQTSHDGKCDYKSNGFSPLSILYSYSTSILLSRNIKIDLLSRMMLFVIPFVVTLFAGLAMCSETQPTGDQLMWEFVNCADSNGNQRQEVWGWQYGNLPGLYSVPNEGHLINIGSAYYYEGQITTWTDGSGTIHKAYIFPGADSDNNGPQGIQVSEEYTGMKLLLALHC